MTREHHPGSDAEDGNRLLQPAAGRRDRQVRDRDPDEYRSRNDGQRNVRLGLWNHQPCLLTSPRPPTGLSVPATPPPR